MHPLTMQETVKQIESRLHQNQFTQHVVINVAKLVNMQWDTQLRESVQSCDLINVDGIGVVWGARLLGYKIPERVAGIDLFSNLLEMAQRTGDSVFLLGARDEVVTKTVEKVTQLYPQLKIAGFNHGYFWDDEKAIADKIRESGAKLLFVAITSPKKENFINQWHDELGVKFVMGVGGTFDIVAGVTRRAPLWMQNMGLEWLYRLLQEPRRMWKRYTTTNSQFAWMLLRGLFSHQFRRQGYVNMNK